jgi:hypothetical protein
VGKREAEAMNLYVYAAVVNLGMLTARASIIAARGGVITQSPIIAVLGIVASFGTIGMLIWGFFLFAWYWPIIILLVGTTAQAVLINRRNVGAWVAAAPLLDVLFVVGAGYLVYQSM